MPKMRDKRVRLSHLEVSIIKGLIERGDCSNQKILGIINANRRNNNIPDINGGRISEIKTGFKLYPNICPATDTEMDRFIANLSSSPNRLDDTESTHNATDFEQLFIVDPSNSNCLASAESETLEYKLSFGGAKSLTGCLVTIAALANNKGGYIVFGVKDQTREIVGIDAKRFREYDFVYLTDILRGCLSCDVPTEVHTHVVDGRTLGILHVMQAVVKPAISISNKDNLKIGKIYYRYSAQNREIGPMELQQIIENRVRSISTSPLSKLLSEILAAGVENSAIYNMATGIVTGPGGAFIIDEAILPKLKFIKEGNFNNIEGAPTLRVVGNVDAINEVRQTVVRSPTRKYPLTSRQLVKLVKERVPAIKQPEIYAIIKRARIKNNDKYSYYIFRNKQQEDEYTKSGNVPSGITSIYNHAAVDFVSEEAARLTDHLRS